MIRLAIMVVFALAILVSSAEANSNLIASERRPPPEAPSEPEPLTALGFEYTVGRLHRGDASMFAAGISVRRTRAYGALSLISHGSVSLLMLEDEDEIYTRHDGLMARLGGTAKLSLWRPQHKVLRGDLFVDGGLGYRVGSTAVGAFHEVDGMVGVGLGYDILEADADSPAKAFSGYLVTRAVRALGSSDAPGWMFAVGMRWTR